MQTRFLAAGLGLSALALVLVVAMTRWSRILFAWLRELLPVVFSGGHCLRLEMGMKCTRLRAGTCAVLHARLPWASLSSSLHTQAVS